MLSNGDITVFLVINHVECPIISSVTKTGSSIVASGNHAFEDETTWNLSWRREIMKDSSETLSKATLNGEVLNWEKEDSPSLSGSFKGIQGSACFKLSIFSCANSSVVNSSEQGEEEQKELITFEITLKQQVQNLYTNPNSYYDIGGTTRNRRSQRAVSSVDFSRASSSVLSPEVPRHHPYTRESSKGDIRHSRITTAAYPPSQHGFIPSPAIASANFDRIESRLRNSENLVSQLKSQLEVANGSIAFLEKSSEKLYHRLGPDQLAKYLSDRLSTDVLAPDMRFVVASARRDALEIVTKEYQTKMDVEVNHICTYFE